MFGRTPLSQDGAADQASEPLFRNAQPSSALRQTFAPRSAAPPVSDAAAAPASAPRPRGAISSLSSAFRLDGDLTGEADLQLDGQVKGDVRVHRLTVGPTARLEGHVVAQLVEIHGKVIGSIQGEIVRLHATADVVGDISPGQLSIENGARFEGRVQPLPSSARDEAAAPAAEAPRAVGEVARLRPVEDAGEAQAVTAA